MPLQNDSQEKGHNDQAPTEYIVMTPGLILQLFAIALLHVLPQCSAGIEMGQDRLWTGNLQEVSAEILYRTIDRVGDNPRGWTDRETRLVRDLDLERRLLAFRSHIHPEIRVFYAECLKPYKKETTQ